MSKFPRVLTLINATLAFVAFSACSGAAQLPTPTAAPAALSTVEAMTPPTATPVAMATRIALTPTATLQAPTESPPTLLPTWQPTAAPTSQPSLTPLPAPTENPAGNFSWQQVDAQNAPPARFDHALALDSDQQRLILFGGRANGQTFGDTWIYDLRTNAWREVNVPGPSPRFGFASVYDPNSKAVYLFGGQKEAFFNDTWKFDTLTETWSQLETGDDAPDIRYGHGVTLDSQNNLLVISHGFARDGRHDDTWGLDLDTNRWTNLTPVGDKPLNRCLHDIAYAGASNVVYLFGGCSSGFGPCPQGDLWAFDVAAGTWSRVGMEGVTPSARQNASIVVNDNTNQLILFGGQAGSAVNDLWVYDPTADTWTQINAEGPSARKSHDAVFDALTNRLYLFGGSTGGGAVNDLWVLQL